VFVYTENLVAETKAAKARSSKRRSASKQKQKTETGEADPMPLLEQAFDMAVQEDGWARLDLMGNALYQLDPGFDPRTYGQRQLSRLIKSLKDQFDMRNQELDGSTLILVRMKEPPG
jgi:Fe-S-cluster formation regulator IscX/YfhJ